MGPTTVCSQRLGSVSWSLQRRPPKALTALLKVRAHRDSTLPFGCGVPSGDTHIHHSLTFFMAFVRKAPHQITDVSKHRATVWGGSHALLPSGLH